MLGFDPLTLAIIAAVTLLAFYVRGLSGFGSSLVGVGALSMVLPPAPVARLPAVRDVRFLISCEDHVYR